MSSKVFDALSRKAREMMNRLMGGRTEPEPLMDTSGGIYRSPACPQTNQTNEADDPYELLPACVIIKCYEDDPPYSMN